MNEYSWDSIFSTKLYKPTQVLIRNYIDKIINSSDSNISCGIYQISDFGDYQRLVLTPSDIGVYLEIMQMCIDYKFIIQHTNIKTFETTILFRRVTNLCED